MNPARNTARRSALAAALVLALAVPAVSGATAHAAPRPAGSVPVTADEPASAPLRLPRPTGPYAVGRDTVHLVDKSRRDPWVPSADARELMVSVYYPGRHGGGRPTAYTSEEEARLLLEW